MNKKTLFIFVLSVYTPIILLANISDTTKVTGFFIINGNNAHHFCILKNLDSSLLKLQYNIDSNNISGAISPIFFELGFNDIIQNSWIVRNEIIPENYADRVKFVRICFAEIAFTVSKFSGQTPGREITYQKFVLYGIPLSVRSDRLLVNVVRVKIYPQRK